MTAAERLRLRIAIDLERRRRMFFADGKGRQVLRAQFRDNVHGDQIAHGTSWGYRNHGCRCDACSEAHSVQQKGYRLQRKGTA